MSDHQFETLHVFETGDFVIQFKGYLLENFYLDEHTIYQQ